MPAKKSHVHIGCSGFRSSRESYYERLDSVEVQHTFYQPPQVATLKRWREEAPRGFEFAVKAWQLITHASSSPTRRRLKRQLTEEEKEGAGSFRPSGIVREAWDVTRECAAALKARAVLFQCPASFRPFAENVENMRRFFLEAERGRLAFCWEPRGDWPRALVKELCDELNLWHVVDPFKERTVTPRRCYFRLHGRRGWRYKYEDAELEELYTMLPKGARSYVFFNNVEMLDDARRFKEIAESES
ncbi:MAG TPA: DUF72 domain-containing protein [Pyrinomonadaceae bacterium]|jgi:uncharacterized protein YecE (DUF72 family)|nr:DUF72 domain-containing protein [Pyrinomonadaceae bacterium]